MRTLAYGFPKLGPNREFKMLLENFWNKKISEEELRQGIDKLKISIAKTYQSYVDLFPSSDVSYYDFVLDTAIMVNAIPKRFGRYNGLSTYFEMARGNLPLQLKKFFNTNYHYLVPELESKKFNLIKNFVLEDYNFLKQSGYESSPKLLGPFTFLKLSKISYQSQNGNFQLLPLTKPTDLEAFMDAILPVYLLIIKQLKEAGAITIFIEEPALCLDITPQEWKIITKAYQKISEISDVFIITYYDTVSDYKNYINLPVSGLGFDFVYGKDHINNIKREGFPSDKILIAGIVNGKEVWRTNIKETISLVEELSKYAREIIISNSCPLFHLPLTIEGENNLPPELLKILAFAKEKLAEIKLIKEIIEGKKIELPLYEDSNIIKIYKNFENPQVKKRIKELTPQDFRRNTPYTLRIELQKKILNLPILPTTTIGSFPQTSEVRKMRNYFKNKKISYEEYEKFIKKSIEDVIKIQEELGLDVLVHGEFERSDMVEFFAEKLNGVATTQNGWVISYGSRVYRPPIIYGDVSRKEPMTIKEITYAQSLTKKIVKGMLTGPVTILNWSYYREDIPKQEIAYQIALALQDEIADLERNNIKIIQIDEPAFREAAPIKKSQWNEYFSWAVKAFCLTVSKTKPETHIQTHMCYSEFNDIIKWIYEMDFDTILIEGTRSKGEILSSFEKFKNWNKMIGIGVYDIHSPEIPSTEKIQEMLIKALEYFPPHLLWINPDCGLKTRKWEEVIPSLQNLVNAAKTIRKSLKSPEKTS